MSFMRKIELLNIYLSYLRQNFIKTFYWKKKPKQF